MKRRVGDPADGERYDPSVAEHHDIDTAPPPIALEYKPGVDERSAWYRTLGSAVGGIYSSVVFVFLGSIVGYAWLLLTLGAVFGMKEQVCALVFSIVATIAFGLLTVKYLRQSLRSQVESSRAYWIALTACHGLACVAMLIAAARMS